MPGLLPLRFLTLLILSALLGMLPVACTQTKPAGEDGQGQEQEYPPSRQTDVADDYHGTRVADPYRWLEDLSAVDTQQWMQAQNALTLQKLAGLDGRDYFAARLQAMLDFERFGLPQRRQGRSVYTYNSGRLEQDQLWFASAPDQPGRLLLDPNGLSADGTVSLGGYELSPDGKYLAYSLSDGGSDWRSWQVIRTDTGARVGGALEGIKFSGVSWRADSQGFFYSRYPEGEQSNRYDDSRQVSLWYHNAGDPQFADKKVYAVTDHPTRNPYGRVTEDGQYLVIVLMDGFTTNGVYVQRLVDGQPNGAVIRLLDRWDARYQFLGNEDRRFFFRTTHKAPLGRIVAIDLDQPGPEQWQTVVAETDSAMDIVSMAGGILLIGYIVDAHARVEMFATEGRALGRVALPGQGTVSGFEGEANDSEVFYSYTDFTTPPSIYRLNIQTKDSAVVHAPQVPFAAHEFSSRQIFYTSKDGTRVPMTIVRRNADSSHAQGPLPTVLYGYGGFNVSLLPRFSAARMAWIEAGGIYAVANIRGGGEYGEVWHQAGTRLNKQNVFDDFIAAAEWLVAEGVTSTEQLAIWGGSNGGLLVGAVVAQRPGLAAVAVPAVGVLDMLRYHTQSANARQWSSDYGLSEDPDEFKALYDYSPLHNLQPGVCYPATLIMADANDDRVAPWHSYKFAAQLQNVQGCSQPVLIRIETRTGHGGGASTSKIISEYTDQWAFVADRLGLAINTQADSR